jgi:hypothetical protein
MIYINKHHKSTVFSSQKKNNGNKSEKVKDINSSKQKAVFRGNFKLGFPTFVQDLEYISCSLITGN